MHYFVLRIIAICSFSLILNLIPAFSPDELSADVIDDGVYQKLNSQEYVRVIVALQPPVSKFNSLNSKMDALDNKKSKVMSKLNSTDFELTKSWNTINAFSGFVSFEGLEKLSQDPDIARVDLDVSGQGGLNQSRFLIGADDVNDAGFTGQGVTVAVLDTGIDTNGFDLEDDIDGQQCFCENEDGSGCCPNGQTSMSGDGSAEDGHGHGTNISGIITSEGNIAPEGIARDAKIVAVKVLDNNNSFSNTSQIISGLEWVLLNRPDVDVVNMSLGTSTLFGGVCDNLSAFNMAFAEVIGELVNSGVVVFASTQNNGSINSIASPACISDTVSVGAVYDGDNGNVDILGCSDNNTFADKVCCFTNSGEIMDLLAPGSQITSTGRTIGISTQSGTSQASAHASASAALLREADPDISPEDIRQVLRVTGATVVDHRNDIPFPRINILAAVNFATGLNINDSNSSPSSFCSVGGKVSSGQFAVVLLFYLLPLTFIAVRRYRGILKRHH